MMATGAGTGTRLPYCPGDRRLLALVDKLREGDAEVARWWDDQTVRDYASVAKRIRHPDAGDLAFGIEVLAAPQEPSQRLIVYPAERDSPTARTLPLLAHLPVGHEATGEPGAADPSTRRV